MKRKLCLLLSIAATCNFLYSLYTAFNDLPILNKIQNIFTIFMFEYFTVIETTTIIFTFNAILFVTFTIPVISIFKGIKKNAVTSS